MKPIRTSGFDGVLAKAGTIASSSGSASVAPTPRSTVRRDRCFFVTNIGLLLRRRSARCRGLSLEIAVRARHRAVAERRALRDRGQDRGEAVVVARGLAHDFAH